MVLLPLDVVAVLDDAVLVELLCQLLGRVAVVVARVQNDLRTARLPHQELDARQVALHCGQVR